MTIKDSLVKRAELEEKIQNDPYNIQLYLKRCTTHASLGFPDLAAMDAYKVLLLVDEVVDESGEFHDEAMESILDRISSFSGEARLRKAQAEPHIYSRFDTSSTNKDQLTIPVEEDEACVWAAMWGKEARVQLVHHLREIGCLRTAYDFVQQLLRLDPDSKIAKTERDAIIVAAKVYYEAKGEPWDEARMNAQQLPERGLVRREIYPWNAYAEDRTTKSALDLLNSEISSIAPKLEVKVTVLPTLSTSGSPSPSKTQETIQLGIFAKEDLLPGEEILHERSNLTANSRLHESFCDACSAPLSGVSKMSSTASQTAFPTRSNNIPVPCDDCDDTIFCSAECRDLAHESYHPAVCGLDVDPIAKDAPAAEAADSLYTLLLLRALAMAQTQSTHPLALREVKHIWGDFVPTLQSRANTTTTSKLSKDNHETDEDAFHNCRRTLPFTFAGNILLPLHALEKMDIPIFTAPHNLAETWVYNTLYAKFRGTASARLNPRDGRPEVAAVHPLWCLANHSCDANVEWEWAGDIRFRVRERRGGWRRKNPDGEEVQVPGREGGIRKGEEILNHYVDLELPVKERREWGIGALGGDCMCERCRWEAED